MHDDKEQLELSNILYAPRDVPEIEVTFNVDINSILNIMSHATASYKDTSTGKSNKITSTAEIDQTVADAEKYKEEDGMTTCIHV